MKPPKMVMPMMPMWWEDQSPYVFIGPTGNHQEFQWGGLPRPPADRLQELCCIGSQDTHEDALRALINTPGFDALGRRRAVAIYGVEHMKAGARRLLRPLLDGGAFVALFTHAPHSLPPGVLSRCAVIRTVAQEVTTGENEWMQRAVSIGAMPPGAARRTALTSLFQSGVKLAEFFQAVLSSSVHTMRSARFAALAETAARCEHAALGSVNTIVHAEDFLTHVN